MIEPRFEALQRPSHAFEDVIAARHLLADTTSDSDHERKLVFGQVLTLTSCTLDPNKDTADHCYDVMRCCSSPCWHVCDQCSLSRGQLRSHTFNLYSLDSVGSVKSARIAAPMSLLRPPSA